MKFSNLMLIYMQLLMAITPDPFRNELEEHVIKSLYTEDENLQSCIGVGSFSKAYSIQYQNVSYAVKKFTSIARWKREKSFLGHIQQYNFEMVPKAFLIGEKRGFIVFQKIDETLKAWLGREYKKLEDQGTDRPVDTTNLRNVLVDIFNGLFLFHEKGLAHGNIHMPNIMIDKKENKVYFVGFAYSLTLDDPIIDIHRLKYKVLDGLENHGIDWFKLVTDENSEASNAKKLKNIAALKVMDKIYRDKRVRILSKLAENFLAPSIQYWIYKIFKIFTNLNSLIDEYKIAIKGQNNN